MAKAEKAKEEKVVAKKRTAAMVSKGKKLRKEVKDLRSRIEGDYLSLAEKLHEIYVRDFYLDYGFKNFQEYCEVELETKYRRAKYLVDIYAKAKELKVPKAKLNKIGWTKAKEIVGVMDAENVDELLELAEEKTTDELRTEMASREDSPTGTRGGEGRVSYQRLSLKMDNSEADVITSAIEAAKKIIESENDVAALEHICQEWMQENEDEAPPSLESILAYIQKVFGVTLVEKKGKAAASSKKKTETTKKSGSKKKTASKKKASPKKKAKEEEEEVVEEEEGTSGEEDDGEDDINKLLGIS